MLMRWMVSAGFRDEADFRARVYMMSMTTCFPGRRSDGSGDRRPTPAEVHLCSSWLDGVLELLDPRLILPVGSLSLSRFLPGKRLDDVVGHAFAENGSPLLDASLTGTPLELPLGRVLLPLPHPSGQSRWLNEPRHRQLLEHALALLSRAVVWAEGQGAPAPNRRCKA
jgi:uracil-DNA glycosylase